MGKKMIPHHVIKIKKEHLKSVINGSKKAELRYDDRNYQVGQIVLMKEWMPTKKRFTGKGTHVRITHIIQCGHFIESAYPWVVFSFEVIVE
jgi:hypothetical protein